MGLNRPVRAWLLLIALLLPLAAHALDPAKTVFQFNIRNWTRKDGLPGNKVTGVTQTADGYIWLATQNGLARFDGYDFKVFPITLPEAGGQDVRVLTPGADGGLWFAIDNGGFGYFDGRTFAPIADPRWNRPDARATTVLSTRNGSVWLGSGLNLGHWLPERPAESTLDTSVTRVTALCEDRAGQVWIGTEYAGLYRWSNGKLSRVTAGTLENELIAGLSTDRKGRLWIATERSLLRCDPESNEATLIREGRINTVFVDSHDVVWAGGTDGLLRIAENTTSYLRKAEGLGSDTITTIFEDREGSLWVGTQDGLTQLSDLKFPIFTRQEGIPAGGLSVAAGRRDGVWVTTSAGFAHLHAGGITTYSNPALLPNPYVKLGWEARNGDFYWVDGDRTISVLRDGKLAARFPSAEWPEAITEDNVGVVVAIGPVLTRVTPTGLKPFTYKHEVPDIQWLDHISAAKDGAIWVASYNGVFQVKDGEFRHWSTADGLSSNRVHFVFEDEDGTIWAGLSTGIARIRGNELHNITEADGLYDNRTYAIVADDHGYFWVNSGRGIYRVSRKALNDFADRKTRRVTCEPFAGEDSVKFTDKLDQEYIGCRSLDGRIWFPNPLGVVMIDPENFVVNRVAPPVHLERVQVAGHDLAMTTQRPEWLKIDGDRVEFFFTALSYISPRRVKVRYQLEGFDSDWVDAGVRRSAQYSLKPGRYAFRVQAANADGVWNTTGATFKIELPPPFYATPWFFGVCGLAVAASLVGGFRWKVRHMRAAELRLREENDRLETRIAGRTRELARSVSLLHATLESVTDGILAVDRTGKVVSFNSKFADLWQVPATELQGTDVSQLRRQVAHLVKDPAAFLKRAEELQQRPETPAFDVIEFSDGRLLERYVSPQLVDGHCVGFVVNWRDITERKRAEADIAYERDLLRALMNSSPDKIYFKDLQSRFLRTSRTQTESFRAKSEDEVLGKTDFDFFTAEHAEPAFADEQRIIQTGQPLIGKVEKETWQDGRVTWALTSKMPLRNNAGEIIGTVGISKDITELKAAEAKLEQLHKQLLETSREAGMAEVATSVLHNVGNVLNSVNVSTALVIGRTRDSKVGNLARIAEMFRTHAGDLAAFLTQDPKGQKLPAYLELLSVQLTAEQEAVATELEHLRKNVEHIKDIVSMQQSYAKVSGISEKVELVEIVEDAVRINSGALSRHEVQVVRDYAARPVLILERHKVMQILVNLIRNAKYACDESGRPDKKLTLRIEQEPGHVKIVVSDNGVGIPAENLTRIFAHGFTTRKEGHGFGLHSGSLAARELGGSLTAHSEGPGRGATFILDLPGPAASEQ